MNIHYTYDRKTIKREEKEKTDRLPKIGDTVEVEGTQYSIFHFDLFNENIIYKLKKN